MSELKKFCQTCKKEIMESKLLNLFVCDCVRKNHTLQIAKTKDGFMTKLVKN